MEEIDRSIYTSNIKSKLKLGNEINELDQMKSEVFAEENKLLVFVEIFSWFSLGGPIASVFIVIFLKLIALGIGVFVGPYLIYKILDEFVTLPKIEKKSLSVARNLKLPNNVFNKAQYKNISSEYFDKWIAEI